MVPTTVTTRTIANALGRTVPDQNSPTSEQWFMWIDDARMLIQARIDSITPTPVVDEIRSDYVIREAVVAQVLRPDDATQVSVSIDDGTVSRTYRTGAGRVVILDDWWNLLGLGSTSSGAFDIDTVSCGTWHADICSLNFGATYCSCGADIAGFPLFEA